MAWSTLEQGRSLKEFTRELLTHPHTEWLYVEGADPQAELLWDTYTEDVEVFLEVTQLLWDTKELSDQEFKQNVHPHIVTTLERSQLFQNLKDPYIKVTEGHGGVRPFRHVMDVAEWTNTDSLQAVQRFMVRWSAYYHDVGKGVSSGLPGEEVDALVAKYDNSRHSFPNHDLISVLVLEQFAKHSEVRKFITKILGFQNWQKFLLLVHNHHVFEFKKKGEVDEFAELQAQMGEIVKDPVQFEALLLTFAFAYSDLHATEKYRQYWPEKLAKLAQLFEVISAQQTPDGLHEFILPIIMAMFQEQYPAQVA